MPDTRHIVYGPHQPEKRERARELRYDMTPAEAHLWEHLRANRLRGLQFRRQQIIDGFIVDFYCHRAGLVVEVDGDVHDEQREYDERPTQVLQQRDLRVLRFRNEQVLDDVYAVLREIVRACRER